MKKIFLLSIGILASAITFAQSVINVTPDPLVVNLACGDSIVENIAIHSNGSSSLSITGGSIGMAFAPDTFYIFASDINGLTSNCGSTNSIYNACISTGTWGFTWNSTNSIVPVGVTVEVFRGIDCGANGGQAFDLNGNFEGNMNIRAGGECICDPTAPTQESYTLNPANYNSGGSNSFNVVNSGDCQGLNPNGAWGGAYARVIVDYGGETWLAGTINPITVPTGDSTIVPVTFYSYGLTAGTYNSIITVESNDPATPIDSIPVILNLNGTADYVLNNNCINFGTVMVNTVHTDTINYTNTGCDTLFINSVTISNSAYSVVSFDNSVDLGMTGQLVVQYNPTTVGNDDDNIFITTNVQDTTICITANAGPAPVIDITPNPLLVTLSCGDSALENIVIHNNGGSDLIIGGGVIGGGGVYDTSTISYSTTGATTIHNFNINNTGIDTLWIMVAANGDFDSGIGVNEYITDVSVDGISLGIAATQALTGGLWDSTLFYVTGANLTTILANGSISITVQNGSGVNANFGGAFLDLIHVLVYTNGVGWMNGTVPSTTVVGGDSLTIPVTFYSFGLSAGTYNSTITVQSNDPVTPTYSLPVTLTLVGTADYVMSDTCINFGGILNSETLSDTIEITNTGCADLIITNTSFSTSDFIISSIDDTVGVGATGLVVVTFSPNSLGSISDNLSITTNVQDTSICLSGISVGTPLSLSTDSLHFTVPCAGGPISDTIIIYNDSVTAAGYEIFTGGLPLDTVLNRMNRFHTNLTSLIPNMYSFVDGVTGITISDGGNDMYDGGNEMNTDISGTTGIPYSDNLIISSTDFGPNGKYFTRKVPGLFVMAADLDNVSLFNITGNLGADGSGSSDGTILTTNAYGSTFTGFVNRTYSAGDPSINRLIIVKDNPSAAHTYLTTTSLEDHEVTGLNTSTRMYYLLFASANGQYVTDSEVQVIMDEFVTWLEAIPSYMNISPPSDTIPGNDSTIVIFTINPAGVQTGTYQTNLIVYNTTPPYSQHSVIITVDITGAADYVFSDSCLHLGVSPPGDPLVDTLFYTNIGCDDFLISALSSNNSDFTILGYDTTVGVGETGYVLIRFNPSSVGNIFGDLIFTTNVQDTIMCVQGVGTNISAFFDVSGQDSCSGGFQFTDVSVGTATSWLWDFGDGTTSIAQNPTHSYDIVATYTVTFIACNSLGCDTTTQTVSPTFAPNYDMLITGALITGSQLTLEVTGSSIISSQWNFGDGSGFPGTLVTHTYADTGTYVVTVDVVTSAPCFFTLTENVVITDPTAGIAELENNLQIYPNPSEGVFYIAVDNEMGRTYDVEILNTLGQSVWSEQNIQLNKHVVQLDEGGMYMIRIVDEAGRYLERKITIIK